MHDIDKRIKTLGEIAADMKRDAEALDGKPFDGKTVATYFGYQGAAIAALANILKEVLEERGNAEPPLTEAERHALMMITPIGGQRD